MSGEIGGEIGELEAIILISERGERGEWGETCLWRLKGGELSWSESGEARGEGKLRGGTLGIFRRF